jgi:rifampicin phosphotransferase
MRRPLIVQFAGETQVLSSEVGGKAASLVRMIDAGLPVPPGAVLTTTFFAPWFDAVKPSAPWNRLTRAAPEEWAGLGDALKEHARSLPLTATQRDALDTLIGDLAAQGDEVRLAVRSSSPDEDLTSSSYAGLYETRLGVRPGDLEQAVRGCFASSLDVRVFTYKEARGFDTWSPRLAVVVQQQLDSDVAGVAFSLNPVTNDYDEAAIDANWGLGTSVVEGRVSPDHFVVDKITRRVVEETLGAKQVSVWLDADGGTVERKGHRSEERTLTDEQLHELTVVTSRIEALYETPVDVEWAFTDGELHVLQARPITAYVPLPPEMVTRPGERRRLYADGALSKGLTINAPISPLGLDSMKSMFSTILESWVGPLNRDVAPADALFFFAGGRMYTNFSNIMWLASPAKLARSAAPTDALMAQILAGIDAKRYRAARRPPWVSARLLWLVPRGLWSVRRFFWNLLLAILAPERAHRVYRQRIAAFASELRERLDDDLPLDELRSTYTTRLEREVFDIVMPLFLVGMVSPRLVVPRRSDEMNAVAHKLTLGITGNVVVEMGIALYRLARHLDRSDVGDLDRLAERIERRELPIEFLSEWDDFLATFGWRGPLEMDLASPRYADDPRLALRQLSFMNVDDTDFDPEDAHRRQVEERQRAYEELMRRLGPLRRALLRRIYRFIDLFSGARDTPKHLTVLFNYAVRKRVLAAGRRLTLEGRLDAAEDVFGLRFDDLEAATQDAALDLRKVHEERTRFRRKLDAHVTWFPPVIDSRGRILRPPPPTEDTPGLLRGMPVSSGVVTGPVKVLRTPHDKVVEKGDVLVAYTTDPGWTPLFVNAAAIVLEVGGVLQHGALVAREYGKPCVVGIDRVVEKLRDGEPVEVNGTTGTVRLLS